MSAGIGCFTVADVHLWVTFEAGTPPCGHVALVDASSAGEDGVAWESEPPISFVGWLGLLRVLSDLLEGTEDR